MAAIGKIRSWGPALVSVIALALFAFIAEELFRSCESTRNDQRQQVGEVLGEKINVQDFQKLVDEYTEVIKMQQGQEQLNEAQMNQVKDMVWNTYVQNKLLEAEAKKLGLTVTDKELENMLKEGTNPMLLQTPFVNQQTGRFDVNSLQRFLADYKKNTNPQMAKQYETIYRYWTFMEKTLRQQTLAQKYQGLLAHCLLSNPVAAKQAFEDENVESQVTLAALPYNSIDDSKVEISESELKAKYNEMKSRFMQYVESRDVKYVDIQVDASEADRSALQKDFAAYNKLLTENEDPSDAVRKSTSLVSYLGIPVAKEAFPSDVAQRLDSMSVGGVFGPYENKQDNTLNLIKLVAKQQLPDSVQYRQIQVSQYQNAPSIDVDSKGYINSLNTMSVNELKNITLPQGNIIVQVVDRKNMINKYTAAVIKKTIDFSKDTYNSAYNKFSSYVSANRTIEDLEKNAQKNGYRVQEMKDVTTSQHYLAGIHSTRDALKWLFEAKEGEISPMYECGDNNHLLVVMLDKIHPIGNRSINDEQVKELVKSEAIKDKKAAQLIAKLEGVKDINGAKAKGATVTDVNQVTFAAPVFVPSASVSEPALSGAIAATPKGKFSAQPVKGNGGVYVFLVNNKTNRPGKLDTKAMEQRLRQKAMQYAGGFNNELYLKAKVVDNRYLFF